MRIRFKEDVNLVMEISEDHLYHHRVSVYRKTHSFTDAWASTSKAVKVRTLKFKKGDIVEVQDGGRKLAVLKKTIGKWPYTSKGIPRLSYEVLTH